MTRDEILSLSGHALSEAVAQHVMRWQRVYVAENVNRLGSTWDDGKGNWRFIPHRELRPQAHGLLGIVAETWEPHGDIRAAWTVLESIALENRVHTSIISTGAEHRVEIIADGESWLTSARSVSILAQEAICRAALLAVLTPEYEP